eukprot:TRINITY_DN25689_c0_g1_i1.p1 TRINITY_DN25689_c0_g1~~TRINITY_DN25689_c0_g1_i1.p1  ORF type:complete len:1076 (+),score=386.78 TRINITY_DN25689_c0_g1_i1:105-3332(+)
MSDSQLEVLVRWYGQVWSGDTSNDERVQATTNIENAKASLGWGCAEAGVKIAERAGSVKELVFFGLHLVEEALEKHYGGVDAVTREQFRAKILSLAQNDAHKSSNHIAEKIGQILSDIAKHDWPSNWPDFFPQLLTLAPCMVTKTLRILFEDIKESTTSLGAPGTKGASKWDCRVSVRASRKRELITGVRSVSSDLLTYLSRDLQSEHASLSTVQCLTALLELIDVSAITASGIIDVVLSLFNSLDPSTLEWEAVCDCVREICTQPSDQTLKAMKAVCQVTLRVATPFISQPCPSSEAHQALRALAQCVEAALPYTRASDYKLMADEGLLSEMVQAALCLLKVPSLPVAAIVLPSLLKVATAGLTEGMGELPGILREALADNISDPDSEEGLQFPNLSWSEDVYEPEDWRAALVEARKDAKALLGILTKAHAATVLQTLTSYARELGTTFSKRHARDEVDATGELVVCSRQAVAWESAAFIFQVCLINPLPGDAPVTELTAALKLCMEVTTTDAAIVSAMASLIGGLGCLYRSDSQLLHCAIDKLFTLMQHRREFEANSAVLSPATTAARRKVMNNFVKLCATRSTELAPLMEPLMSSASNLVSKGLQGSEVSSICEGLTSVSNHMPDEAQAKVLDMITQPALGMMRELQHLSSPQALSLLLQQPTSDSSRCILYVASTLSGVFRHTKRSMLQPLAAQIMEPVVAALQSLSALHGQASECLPAQLRPMLEAAPDREGWTVANDSEQHVQLLVDTGRDFINEIWGAFIELLGGIVAVTPALHEHYAALNAGGIASNLNLPALRAFFFHFNIRFVYSCPAHLVAVAGKFTNATCRMAGECIGKLYDRTHAAEEDVSAELREVSMLAVDLLVRASRARQSDSEMAVTEHLLRDPVPATALIHLVASTFVWDDESVITKALGALRKVHTVLVTNQDVHRNLFVLYVLCLRRLQGAKLKEGLACRIGHDSKEDKLLDGCVVTVAILLHAMGNVHDIFVTTLQSVGVGTAKELVEEVLAEPQEGRRISTVRSALAKYVAGGGKNSGNSPRTQQIELPRFAPMPFPDRSPFDDANCVPVRVL